MSAALNSAKKLLAVIGLVDHYEMACLWDNTIRISTLKKKDMNKNELITSTRKKLDEMDHKIETIKENSLQQTQDEMKQQTRTVLQRLTVLRDEIKDQVIVLSKNDKKDDSMVSEFEKNIYKSIKSFDSAITKAGGLFRSN